MMNQGGARLDTNTVPTAPISFEQIEPRFASWGKRVAAAVLDGAIGGAATFLAFGDQPITLPFIGVTAVRPDGQGTPGHPWPANAWTDSGWVVATVLVIVAMQAYLGATPGKLVLGIAVVRDNDARPIGLVRTIVRSLVHLLDSLFFIGYLRPLWNAQRRTFADSILSTVVLDTRRPRRHRWFARDPGPPDSWEAPMAPGWWPVVTAISAVVCMVGVLFTFGPSSERGSIPFELSCEMTKADGGPIGFTGGTLSSSSDSATTTRLGVSRRTRGSDGQIKATWRWSATPGENHDVTLRASMARADGTGGRRYDFAMPPEATQEATKSLPPDALKGLGDCWTLTETILVGAVESPPCRVSAQGFPGV
jgi:Mce-associated membrane protein